MPSGKTHDAITILLGAPTFIAAWGLTRSLTLASVATGAMFFGGLMFGPDLDVQSKQYTRWGVFRFLWLPYKVIFRHRSRWSHGLIFGTLIRVIYFTGILALVAAGAVYLRALLVGGAPPGVEEVLSVWRMMDTALKQSVGNHVLWVTFCGLWWGAASHTLTDVGWSMLRKGSEIF
ncbi:MAG: metal-binding protein [Acidobacteria bacterium]|nr:metal-binding protein [Acidobacteriota bacterium]